MGKRPNLILVRNKILKRALNNMENVQQSAFGNLYQKYEWKNPSMDFNFLWHYTSADGLVGIIRPQEPGKLHFWFTRSDCLNDTSEGTYILTLYRQVCDSLLDSGVIDQKFHDYIVSINIPSEQYINPSIPSPNVDIPVSILDWCPCQAYISCFSLKEDSLDMWRYYSRGNGGYGLKLNSFIFNAYLDPENFNSNEDDKDIKYVKMTSFKVVYDKEKQEEELRNIIADVYLAYQASCLPDKEDEAKKFIQYALSFLQFRFKHPCFSSEQEYRFVAYRPISEPSYLKDKLPDVEYRTQNGEVVPYIDLIVTRKADYLTEVLISPYMKSQSALVTTRDYLAQSKFNCEVKISELPVR